MGTRGAGQEGDGAGALSAVSAARRRYDPDPGHSEQVRGLALALFDELQPLHAYGPRERRLLEVAARLHDIGWAQAYAASHHKQSGAMIRGLTIPALTGKDLITCSLVARYHNGSLPEAGRHRRFASLSRRRQAAVEWLAGILRVADGLDNRHRGLVKKLTCKVKRDELAIRIACRGDCRAEIRKAVQKQDLLMRVASRSISYRCTCGNALDPGRNP